MRHLNFNLLASHISSNKKLLNKCCKTESKLKSLLMFVFAFYMGIYFIGNNKKNSIILHKNFRAESIF